jgi:tetratricopeptide (TPR) repeat protein
MEPIDRDLQTLEGLLRWRLSEKLKDLADSEESVAPSSIEILDLVEGRLSATEREDLIERLASHPEWCEPLADVLWAYERSEARETRSVAAEEATPSPLERIKRWLEECVVLLSPAVTAYSADVDDKVDLLEFARENNLLSLIDFESLDGSFEKMVCEIEEIIDDGFQSGEIFNIQAAVMEVHLVLSRDRGGEPATFFKVWGPLCGKGGNLGAYADYASGGGGLGWAQAYGLIRNVYDRAIDLDPEQGEIYIGLGRIDLQLGEYERAEKNLKKGVALSPGESAAYHLLARLRELRERREAEETEN